MRRKDLARFVVCWLPTAATVTSGLFTPVFARQLPVKTYTTADGLAGNRIESIFQDSRGFLWIGTGDGLSRFDGYRFINYTTEQGLAGNHVADFLETRRGEYWVATYEGVCRLDPRGKQRFIRFPLGEHRQGMATALVEDRAGTIWCGTHDGLFRLEGQTFRPVDLGLPHASGDDTIITSIREDSGGSMWFGTGGGLYRRRADGRTTHYTARDGLPHVFVTDLLLDRQGQLWIGTTQGLCLASPKSNDDSLHVQRVYTVRDGLGGDRINSLLETSSGKLWVEAGSLNEFLGTRFQSYGPGNGLAGAVGPLMEDRYGNLWVGTDGAGLMKIPRNGFIGYSEADGLASHHFDAILEDRQGALCVVTPIPGSIAISRFDGQHFHATRLAFPSSIKYFGWGDAQNVFQDHTGEWWAATGQGVCRFPRVGAVEQLAHRQPIRIYTTSDGLIGNNIFRLFEDSRGDVWAGSIGPPDHEAGLARWKRGTDSWHPWREVRSAPSAFCNDSAGNLWIGFLGGGLMRFRDGRFTVMGEKEGLSSHGTRQIYLDRAGRLWIGTYSLGLLRIDHPAEDHPRMIAYTTVQGLSSNRVAAISEDRWGRLYVATGFGVDRLEVESGRIQRYTTADGLARGELRLAFQDRQGVLWFATQQGLSQWTPRPDLPKPPPAIFFTGVRVAGVPRRISDVGETNISRLELKPDQNQLLVEFVGLDLAPGETLHYQYMLDGVDRRWSAPVDERTVNYASLRPGTYRFLVRAMNSQGAVSAEPASLMFTILPPVWQRWWFLTLLALAAASVIYALHQIRVARLLELERIRNRIATDLHDDIGASLSQIAVLSEVARVELARGDHQAEEPLVRIAGVSRELVDSMSEIVWAVNPYKDRLRDLTQHMREFAGDVFVARHIKFDFRAPQSTRDIKLGMDARRQIFLIFKECVHNISRHSGCTRVEVELSTEGDWLKLRVSDDGHGFQPPALDGQLTGAHGHGLKSMHARAGNLGGVLDVRTAENQGVTVILQIPLARRGVQA